MGGSKVLCYRSLCIVKFHDDVRTMDNLSRQWNTFTCGARWLGFPRNTNVQICRQTIWSSPFRAGDNTLLVFKRLLTVDVCRKGEFTVSLLSDTDNGRTECNTVDCRAPLLPRSHASVAPYWTNIQTLDVSTP